MDIRATFDSVERSALWTCMPKNKLLEKYVSILKTPYQQTLVKVRVYGELPPPFAETILEAKRIWLKNGANGTHAVWNALVAPKLSLSMYNENKKQTKAR